ncbi:Retrovirus-related Pol polyprotein from transposon TNT 1-94 [Senna tora]|uniref:Retrovirus-related Pol polyprotein from transposon TNT 1-94 n=1 Tax=Senna tora TaxID=362788 RepID=A0A835CAG2_9FABA|nr:Retrovirus-related Pol polyprotein from transposon TNT 1-94 [Senna tora]
MQLQQQYDGGEKVYISNGQGLSIPNIGESYILANKDAILQLKNLLHVPSITKNLLSVSKLAKDNNIFFEFYANEVFVKCQETKEILLKGRVKDALYCFDNMQLQHLVKSNPSTAYVTHSSNSNSFELWHSRLGH